jgi:hypothetical protein
VTRCNALPNVDTGRGSEIIPYLLDPVTPFRSGCGGLNDAKDGLNVIPGFADSAPYEDLTVKKK